MTKCYAQCLARGECWMGQLALLLPPTPWRCINLAGLFNPDASQKPPCSCTELKYGEFPNSYDVGTSNALAGCYILWVSGSYHFTPSPLG